MVILLLLPCLRAFPLVFPQLIKVLINPQIAAEIWYNICQGNQKEITLMKKEKPEQEKIVLKWIRVKKECELRRECETRRIKGN